MMNWIKCNEKLPDSDLIDCLVKDESGNLAVGCYKEDAKAWYSNSFGWLERKYKTKVDDLGNYIEPCGLGKIVEYIPIKDIEVAIKDLKDLKVYSDTVEELYMKSQHTIETLTMLLEYKNKK